MKRVKFEDLGVIRYKEAWDYQEQVFGETVDQKIRNRSAENPEREVVHHLLFCEHPPVITLGKNANASNVLLSAGVLQQRNIELYPINRGGDVTFHGPGQLVGYPILDLDDFFTDIGKYLRSIEEVIIRTIAEYGILGDRIPGVTGVWLDAENPFAARKICAIGIRCSRWVTMHGFAFNVNTDLRYFDTIVPCGLSDKKVTSLQRELGTAVDFTKVKEQVKRHFEEVFGCELYTF